MHHDIETQKSLNYKLRNYKHFRERIGVGGVGNIFFPVLTERLTGISTDLIDYCKKNPPWR